MMNPEYKQDRIDRATEIVTSIDHWLDNWCKGKIDGLVGALIQRTAMRELSFMEYLDKKWIPMDELRSMANDQLERMGRPRIPKPLPLMIMPGSIIDFKVPVPSVAKAVGSNFYPFPFPSFTDITKKSRRGELEDMTFGEISELYKNVQREKQKSERDRVNKLRKKNRITSILKHEGVE